MAACHAEVVIRRPHQELRARKNRASPDVIDEIRRETERNSEQTRQLSCCDLLIGASITLNFFASENRGGPMSQGVMLRNAVGDNTVICARRYGAEVSVPSFWLLSELHLAALCD